MGSGGSSFNYDPKMIENLKKEIEQSFSDLKEKILQTRTFLNELSTENEFYPVHYLYELMELSFETAISVTPEDKIPHNHVNYKQAISSLEEFQKFAQEYSKNKSEKTFKKLEELSGHFQDRIAQQALNWGGKAALIQHYVEIKKKSDALTNTISELANVTSILSEFTNKTASEALHTQYSEDFKQYRLWANVWLGTTLVGFILLLFLSYKFWNISNILYLDIKEGEKLLTSSVILIFAPRVAAIAVTLTASILCWRNYHSYKHLQVTARQREKVGLILPILIKDERNDNIKSELKKEFLALMAKNEETGFIAQAKQSVYLGWPFSGKVK